MKTYRMNVDFKGKEKSWCKSFEIEAENENEALSKMYLQLHGSMRCTFRVWSCVEQVENPKLVDERVFASSYVNKDLFTKEIEK